MDTFLIEYIVAYRNISGTKTIHFLKELGIHHRFMSSFHNFAKHKDTQGVSDKLEFKRCQSDYHV